MGKEGPKKSEEVWSRKKLGARKSDGTLSVGTAEAATGAGVTYGVGRQGTDPVGDLGN